MRERWRAIPGYEGRYDASDHGRIRSWLKSGPQTGARRPQPLVLTPGIETQGREQVILRISGDKYPMLVHRLILLTFVGPPPSGFECGHLNGKPRDNRLLNLQWVSRAENCAHKWRHGTVCAGMRNSRSKLTDAAVLAIRASLEGGPALAARFGVTKENISCIRRRGTWTHL